MEKIIAEMEKIIDKSEARKLLMNLLEGYDFSDATDDYKARCFTAVFCTLELLRD